MNNKKLTDVEKNLIVLLRLFQGRPYHLAKYLLENNILNQEFLDKITESNKLKDLHDKYETSDIPTLFFLNFNEMLKFFETISDEYNFTNPTNEKTQIELNSKLDDLIKSEKYEEAIKIRDYMIQNNIKRNI